MSDAAAVHAIAVKLGFDDLLEWDIQLGELTAWVEVYGLHVNHAEPDKVSTVCDAHLLAECLAECEGHGLLWREDACLLYAARRLGVKPQPWAYSESDEINRLFDAIGAE